MYQCLYCEDECEETGCTQCGEYDGVRFVNDPDVDDWDEYEVLEDCK